MTEACPRCGEAKQVVEGFLASDVEASDVRDCARCWLWWRPGDAGRGWEWWSEHETGFMGWTKAPEGVLTVLGGEE